MIDAALSQRSKQETQRKHVHTFAYSSPLKAHAATSTVCVLDVRLGGRFVMNR